MNWWVRSIKKFMEFWIILNIYLSTVSISTFTSLVVIPVSIASSAIGLKLCVITAGIEKYKSIIKKKKKSMTK